MTQFIFGMLAGVIVGLVMEWVIDWTGLLPKRSALDRTSSKSGQKSGASKSKRAEKETPVQAATVTSSSNPETSGK